MRILGILTKTLVLACMVIVLLPSCVSHQQLTSLNANEVVPENLRAEHLVDQAQSFIFKPYKVRPYDQIMISINAFDGSTEEFLNREFATENTDSRNINYDPSSLYFNSYLVDDSGYIFLPILNKVKVAGYNLLEIKQQLDEAYSAYLKFATTNVKLANMRVTVLGEVNKPGVHYLYSDYVTLLDAISLAGDFTDFSNRMKVKLIRLTENGSKTVYLNLNRSDFIYSEYFYVRPYDIIYIEPTRAKPWNVNARTVGNIISAVSVAALLINILIDLRK